MSRARSPGRAASLAFVGFLGLSAPPVAPAAADVASELRATRMVFVRTRDADELVVRAERALLYPDSDIAELEGVEAVFSNPDAGRRVELSCDRAELDTRTTEIRAEGNVVGLTDDGRRYSAPWVHYDHEAGLLLSDAPVEMIDDSGTFRGDGFRFHLEEGRFQLLGHVRVVQTQ